jgi:hypothetical protein
MRTLEEGCAVSVGDHAVGVAHHAVESKPGVVLSRFICLPYSPRRVRLLLQVAAIAGVGNDVGGECSLADPESACSSCSSHRAPPFQVSHCKLHGVCLGLVEDTVNSFELEGLVGRLDVRYYGSDCGRLCGAWRRPVASYGEQSGDVIVKTGLEARVAAHLTEEFANGFQDVFLCSACDEFL